MPRRSKSVADFSQDRPPNPKACERSKLASKPPTDPVCTESSTSETEQSAKKCNVVGERDSDEVDKKRPRLLEDSDPAKPKQPSLDGMLGKTNGESNTAAFDRVLLNKRVAELKRKLAADSSRSVLELIKPLHTEWLCMLENQILSEKFRKLADFIMAERAGKTPIYPPADQVFSWSHLCSPSSVRVVILGQDPYHGPKQAHGLAFSVQRPVPPPPSLVNMYKEIKASIPQLGSSENWPPNHGDLTGWARQGVLLLNAVLTVRASMANSHKDKGWELLTDAVVRYLSQQKSHLVFMLWGANAQSRGAKIDRKRHLVLESPHPSPLSASRGFFGCGHFAKTNDYLREHGMRPIDWANLD